MRSSDKHLEQATEIIPDDSDDVDGEDAPCAESVTLEKERHRFETEDKPFWNTYNFLLQELSNVMSKNSEEDYICFVNNPDIRKSATIKDHMKRSILHVAVEQSESNLVKCLINMGLDAKVREGCGTTPLSLAVLTKNTWMCKLLGDAGARHSGPLFTSIPSPSAMATKLELDDIQDIFNQDSLLSDEEDELVQQIDDLFYKKKPCIPHTPPPQSLETCNRTNTGFVTPVVGGCWHV